MASIRVGLVLGAGGVVGQAYHSGVLAALHAEIGWDAREAHLIVGTSAGSVTGAFLRGGVSPADLVAYSTRTPLTSEALRRAAATARQATTSPPPARRLVAAPRLLARAATRPWELVRPGVVIAAALPDGTRSLRHRTAVLTQLVGGKWPDGLWLCAVRLSDGRRVVFGREGAPATDVGTAVAASCAIPAYFEPVEIDGVRHVDGGVYSPTNAELCAGLELDLVIVCSPLSTRHLQPVLDWGVRAASGLRLRLEVEAVRRRGTPVVVFQPQAEDLSVMGPTLFAMDTARGPDVARHIEAVTRERLRADARLGERLEPLAAASNGARPTKS
jgi:NTE family protein